MNNYYIEEIAKKIGTDIRGAQIKLSKGGKSTHWMNLNAQSIPALVEYLEHAAHQLKDKDN